MALFFCNQLCDELQEVCHRMLQRNLILSLDPPSENFSLHFSIKTKLKTNLFVYKRICIFCNCICHLNYIFKCSSSCIFPQLLWLMFIDPRSSRLHICSSLKWRSSRSGSISLQMSSAHPVQPTSEPKSLHWNIKVGKCQGKYFAGLTCLRDDYLDQIQ